MSKIWYITGASKGLGLTLVRRLLHEGYKVAATSRNVEELKNAVKADKSVFLPMAVDLTGEVSVQKSVASAIEHFGSIDVVVNNAGYGLAGAIEELTDAEARANFDINVFGSLNVIRRVLPFMRQQGSGSIFNIASIGGFTGAFPGFGIYCATKFAVHGFSESLAAELKDFGIKVTIVSPGYFRTSFLDSSLNVPAHQINEYRSVRESQAVHQGNYNGNQMGDPEKAAGVIIDVFKMDQPPLHLFLGQDAYDLAEVKMNAVKADMLSVRGAATATAFEIG